MPATSSCTPTCGTTALSTPVPGPAGQSAFTLTVTAITVPDAALGPVIAADGGNIEIGNSDWLAIGATIFISDGTNVGHFEVVTIPDSTHVTLLWLDQTGDSVSATVIAAGAKVVASGAQVGIDDPLLIANGGTGQITAALARAAILESAPLAIAEGGTAGASKAAALTALGIGQSPTVDNKTGIAYDITAAAAQITGVSAAVPTTGVYLILAHVTVLYTGVTFAASRTLTIKVRNITSAADLVTTTRATNAPTTTGYISIDYVLPFYTGTLTAAHNIQLYIDLSVVESAGSSVVTDASIVLVPLAI